MISDNEEKDVRTLYISVLNCSFSNMCTLSMLTIP